MRQRLTLGLAVGAAAAMALAGCGSGSGSSSGSGGTTTLSFFGADYGTGPANSTSKNWTAIAAGTLLFLLPVAIFTFLLRRHLLRGVTFGTIRK